MQGLEKSINTCLSVATRLDIEEVAKAKRFLTKNYKNRYSLSPHLTYMISPFPEYNLKEAELELDKYFKNQKRFTFKLSKLGFEPVRKFYSLPVMDGQVMKLHKDMLKLLNKYRDGHIREKDVTRIERGEISNKEIGYIKKYGYFRVLDNFTPHLTVGSVEAEDSEIPTVTKKLKRLLSSVLQGNIQVNEVLVNFHTDSENQSEMKSIWEKKYKLKKPYLPG